MGLNDNPFMTPGDWASDMLSDTIDNFAPGMSSFLTPLIMKKIKGLTGNDMAWDTIIGSDRGAMGMWNEYQRRSLSAMRNSITMEYSREAMRNNIRNIQMTAMSREHFATLQQTRSDLRGINYDSWIENRVNNWMNKGGVATLYNLVNGMTGFDQASMDIAQGRGALATNIARAAMRRMDPGALSAGRGIASQLLAGYNKSDFGGITEAGATDVAAILSSRMDVLYGTNASSTEDVKRAMDRFKKTVTDYTRALAPLKEIMGNDTKKMIQAIEEVAGQSIQSMDVERVRNLSKRMASATTLGLYDVKQDIEPVSARIMSRMSQTPGLPTVSYISAPEQTMAALAQEKGGQFTPTYVTPSQWRAYTAERTFQTSNSKAADLFAKAYALWGDRNNVRSPMAFEQFQRNVTATAQRTGQDARQVAMQMAGVSQAWELEAGRASSRYQSAMQSGDAGFLDRQTQFMHDSAIMARAAGFDAGYIGGLGLNVSSPAATAQATQIFNATLRAYAMNPNMERVTDDAQLGQMLGAAGIRMSPDMFRRSLQYMKTDDRYSKILLQAAANANEREDRVSRMRYDARRDSLETMNAAVFDSSEGIAALFQGGWSTSRFQGFMSSSASLRNMQMPGAVAAMMDASGRAATAIVGTDAAKAGKFAGRMYSFSTTDTARQSKGFTAAEARYNSIYSELQQFARMEAGAAAANNRQTSAAAAAGHDAYNEKYNAVYKEKYAEAESMGLTAEDAAKFAAGEAAKAADAAGFESVVDAAIASGPGITAKQKGAAARELTQAEQERKAELESQAKDEAVKMAAYMSAGDTAVDRFLNQQGPEGEWVKDKDGKDQWVVHKDPKEAAAARQRKLEGYVKAEQNGGRSVADSLKAEDLYGRVAAYEGKDKDEVQRIYREYQEFKKDPTSKLRSQLKDASAKRMELEKNKPKWYSLDETKRKYKEDVEKADKEIADLQGRINTVNEQRQKSGGVTWKDFVLDNGYNTNASANKLNSMMQDVERESKESTESSAQSESLDSKLFNVLERLATFLEQRNSDTAGTIFPEE